MDDIAPHRVMLNETETTKKIGVPWQLLSGPPKLQTEQNTSNLKINYTAGIQKH